MGIGDKLIMFERKEKPISKQFIDITGETFNNLFVLGYHGKDKTGNHLWICKCTCGNQEEFLVRSGHIKNGHTKSCGCLSEQNPGRFKKNHSLTGTVEYAAWCAIKNRCYNKNCERYPNYGGRGIKVCDEWINDPVKFAEDMGQRPPDKTSIDRKDVNGNYCKDNCEWANNYEQMNNTTRNRYITFNEKTLTASEWQKETGILAGTIIARLNKGWSVERAITEKPVSFTPKTIEYNGEVLKIKEWSDKTGLTVHVIESRLRLGWSPKDILTTPVGEKRNANANE